MTNSTSTDVIVGGAWCHKRIANQKHCYSTAKQDKQIIKLMLQQTTPYSF